MPKIQSLVAKMEGELALPAILDTLPAIPESRGVASAYIQFMTKKAGVWDDTARAIPGLAPGDAVLFRPDGPPVKLSPFKCHFLTGKHYYARTDDSYTLEHVIAESDDGRTPEGYTEFIDSVLLVHVDGGIIPASCRFRGATCNAAKKLSDALKAAASPEWGKLSPEHAASLGAPKPFQRFYGVISTGTGLARGSGRTFVRATAAISPIGAVEGTALAAFLSDPAGNAALGEVAQAYGKRCDEVVAAM
jgi:hypothetical protein